EFPGAVVGPVARRLRVARRDQPQQRPLVLELLGVPAVHLAHADLEARAGIGLPDELAAIVGPVVVVELLLADRELEVGDALALLERDLEGHVEAVALLAEERGAEGLRLL